jgi:Na+-transporting NADH:ubiquinone oxidoreductase subunit NqrD
MIASSLLSPPKGSRVHTADMIQALVQVIPQIIGALGLTGVAIRYAPLVIDRARLIGRLQAAESRNADLEKLLTTLQGAAAGWEIVREEVQLLRSQFGSAVLYIGELVTHIRDGGTSEDMPVIPSDLQEAVNLSLRQREAQAE